MTETRVFTWILFSFSKNEKVFDEIAGSFLYRVECTVTQAILKTLGLGLDREMEMLLVFAKQLILLYGCSCDGLDLIVQCWRGVFASNLFPSPIPSFICVIRCVCVDGRAGLATGGLARSSFSSSLYSHACDANTASCFHL